MNFSSDDYRKIFHEIKNSITLINSSLQLAQKQCPEIETSAHWKEAQKEMQNLKNMLAIFSHFRIGDGLHLAELDVTSFIHQIRNNLHHYIDASSFDCTIHMPKELPHIKADSLQLKLAIFNLIKNSYEAMEQHGEVVLSAAATDDTVQISVEDSGGGIQPTLCSNLFTEQHSTKSVGSGLGLPIVYDIVTAHNGTIHFENNPPKGCTFFINLPIK